MPKGFGIDADKVKDSLRRVLTGLEEGRVFPTFFQTETTCEDDSYREYRLALTFHDLTEE